MMIYVGFIFTMQKVVISKTISRNPVSILAIFRANLFRQNQQRFLFFFYEFVYSFLKSLKPKTHQHKGAHVHGVLITSKPERTVSAYLLEFSLAIHSVIIGITVGVAANSELAALIPVLCFHQLFEGIALGAMLAVSSFY
jgi:zinc transporter ZupT